MSCPMPCKYMQPGNAELYCTRFGKVLYTFCADDFEYEQLPECNKRHGDKTEHKRYNIDGPEIAKYKEYFKGGSL